MIDWKSRLLETTTKKALPLQKVVQEIVADGVPVADVKRFLAEHQDQFGQDAQDIAKRAAEALLDQTSPKLPMTSVAGKRALDVRLQQSGPLAAAPSPSWFTKAGLTSPPITLQGKGEPVVVDGEKFTQHDVAELLKLAA